MMGPTMLTSERWEQGMSRGPRYEEPFYWWGPGWETPAPRDIGDLLRDGTIDIATASLLWAALARRRSLAIVAGPSGTGKTTLLSALIALLPAGTRRVYPRGCFETFAFLSDPAIMPERTALLVNEISPHLPVYLWGPGVARVLAATERGFCVLATAHATSIAEFVGGLIGSPLRLPAPLVAALEFVAILEHTDASASGRRVREVCRLRQSRGGVAVECVGAGRPHNISQSDHDNRRDAQSSWFAYAELKTKAHVLTSLRDRAIERLPIDHAPLSEIP